MRNAEAVITATMIARGLVDIYERVIADGSSVQQDTTMPQSARRALARLSRLCLDDGAADLGSSIHMVMASATRPFGDWLVPAFAQPFRYADVELADAEFGVPTDDCRELARLAGSEIDAAEDLHHEQLRAAIASYPAGRRHEAYATIREFVVRHPCLSLRTLHDFIGEGNHAHAARAIASLYRTVPQTAIVGGHATTCGRCGSLLWPERDPAYPSGRCRVRRCAVEGDTVPGERIDDPSAWRVATSAILAFWVGPGLDEIRLHDALRQAGRQTALYPQSDAADVGIDGLSVGVDVKSYASPLLLGARLSRSIGRLALFDRRIIAVPDYKLGMNASYMADLAGAYSGDDGLEFATISQVQRELGR